MRRLAHPAVLVLLGLGLGLGLGAWAMRLYFNRTLARWDPTTRFVDRLGWELDLDSEQRRRVALVLAEQKARMDLRRRAWQIEVGDLARDGEDQIAQLLNPEQTRRFLRLHDSIHGRLDQYLWSSEREPTALALGPGN